MSLTWQPPQPGPAVRGTVIVLPGRGEHAGVYERLGRRLAFDAYCVHALDLTADDGDLAGLRDRIAAITSQATAPVVLIGSDTGALHALALVTHGKVDVEGLVLAAIPSPRQPSLPAAGILRASSSAADAWERELAARTTCPTHRGKLTEDAAFRRGSLFEPVPDRLGSLLALDESEYAEIGAATLILHGGADPIAPAEHARELAARLPQAELAVVRTAPHDVLNDATHRSVAALIVQWLERVRSGPGPAPIFEFEDVGASSHE